MRLDAHQHFWNYSLNPKDYVWMTDDLSALRRDYLPSDLAPLRRRARIDGTIAVQAREMQVETDFLLGLAANDPTICGVVGWLDLCADDVEAWLDRYDDVAALKGLRMLIHDREDPNFADSREHLDGVSRLERRGLTYDLLLRTLQIPSAIRLVDALQNQAFVVDHIAKPKMDGSDLTSWAKGIRDLGMRPNVMCKLSGLVSEADWANWDPATFTPFLDIVLDAFGTERLMVGSNWPVCTLAGDYTSNFDVVSNWASGLSETEHASLFGGNCAKFYGVV